MDESGLVDGAPAQSRESLVPMYVALVETMRKDWAGTGIDFVFLPDCDFEILPVNGNRRRLVAAQLGDTAEPNVRICAVWSPSAKGQFLGTRAGTDAHKARHEE